MEFYLMVLVRDDLENGLEVSLFCKRKLREIRLKAIVRAIPSLQRHRLENRCRRWTLRHLGIKPKLPCIL